MDTGALRHGFVDGLIPVNDGDSGDTQTENQIFEVGNSNIAFGKDILSCVKSSQTGTTLGISVPEYKISGQVRGDKTIGDPRLPAVSYSNFPIYKWKNKLPVDYWYLT